MDDVQAGSGGTERSELLAMKGTVDELLGEVESLGERLEITDTVVRRGKRNQRFIAVLLGLSLVLGLGLVWQARKVSRQQDTLAATAQSNKDLLAAQKAAAVKGCQNANDSRKGALLLWTVIINAPRSPSAPPRTAQEEKVLADLMTFIGELYKDRDCQNLQKTYPLPTVPDSLQPK